MYPSREASEDWLIIIKIIKAQSANTIDSELERMFETQTNPH